MKKLRIKLGQKTLLASYKDLHETKKKIKANKVANKLLFEHCKRKKDFQQRKEVVKKIQLNDFLWRVTQEIENSPTFLYSLLSKSLRIYGDNFLGEIEILFSIHSKFKSNNIHYLLEKIAEKLFEKIDNQEVKNEQFEICKISS